MRLILYKYVWYFCQRMSFFYVKICELYRLYQFAAGFSTFERVRARKGGLSKDNVLSSGERCWKCSLLNSLSTHIKTKCLYMRCFGSSRSLAAIFIFPIVNSYLVPFLHIIGCAIRANYLFPMICEFHEI